MKIIVAQRIKIKYIPTGDPYWWRRGLEGKVVGRQDGWLWVLFDGEEHPERVAYNEIQKKGEVTSVKIRIKRCAL